MYLEMSEEVSRLLSSPPRARDPWFYGVQTRGTKVSPFDEAPVIPWLPARRAPDPLDALMAARARVD
jgi:hypothetical protein